MTLTLISTHTASADSSIDITSGIDSTYSSYEWHFVNCHPATNNVNFCFQVNADGQSGFNEAISSNSFRAYLKEDGTGGTLSYDSGALQGNGTALQRILSTGTGSDNDQCVSGVMTLFAPSSTTYVKHFTAVGNGTDHGEYTVNSFMAGYINVTAAIDEITFKFDSGNIDDGTIKMFGVS